MAADEALTESFFKEKKSEQLSNLYHLNLLTIKGRSSCQVLRRMREFFYF